MISAGGAEASATDVAAFYDALAPVYDAWQSADGMTPFALVAYEKLEPELERWSRHHGAVRSFLDLGCATGELLLALAITHPGWRLAGVDLSARMLAVAAGKPGAGGISWARAPIEGPLPFAGRFDAAGAFYDTLNHLPDAGALGRAFAAVAAALRPGGLLVFDVTNALGFERWWHGSNRWAGPGWSVAVATAYDRPSRTGRAAVTIDAGGGPRSLTLVERLFTDDEIRSGLEAAGLSPVRADPWSPFALDAPGKTLWIVRNSGL